VLWEMENGRQRERVLANGATEKQAEKPRSRIVKAEVRRGKTSESETYREKKRRRPGPKGRDIVRW